MIMLLALACSAAAQEAGKIVSIVGKAEVLQAGEWQRARLAQGLSVEEVIRTGPGSRVAILLANESQIKVNANSTLEMKQIGPSPGQPIPAGGGFLQMQTLINLLSGE